MPKVARSGVSCSRESMLLHRELKLHCVKSDVSVMEFVVNALGEKLQREAGRTERCRRRA